MLTLHYGCHLFIDWWLITILRKIKNKKKKPPWTKVEEIVESTSVVSFFAPASGCHDICSSLGACNILFFIFYLFSQISILAHLPTVFLLADTCMILPFQFCRRLLQHCGNFDPIFRTVPRANINIRDSKFWSLNFNGKIFP